MFKKYRIALALTPLMLSACATPTTNFNANTADQALLIHWGNKEDFVWVPVDLEKREVIGDRLIIKNRTSAPKLNLKANDEDKAKIKKMLDDGWKGRKTVDYATKVLPSGTYAFVWWSYDISDVGRQGSNCLLSYAPVFKIDAGKINTLETWGYLRDRVRTVTSDDTVWMRKNNDLLSTVLKEYPDIKGDLQAAKIVATVRFETNSSFYSQKCLTSGSFDIIEQ